MTPLPNPIHAERQGREDQRLQHWQTVEADRRLCFKISCVLIPFPSYLFSFFCLDIFFLVLSSFRTWGLGEASIGPSVWQLYLLFLLFGILLCFSCFGWLICFGFWIFKSNGQAFKPQHSGKDNFFVAAYILGQVILPHLVMFSLYNYTPKKFWLM